MTALREPGRPRRRLRRALRKRQPEVFPRATACCRRGYELGRLASGSRRALGLAPMLALPLWGCSEPGQVLACGGALLVLVTILPWRGEEYGSGVGPGVAAGLLPLLLPVFVQATAHACVLETCSLLPAMCAVGGLAGGVLLALLAPRPRPGRMAAFVSACGVAALAGSVGCCVYGLFGLALMAAGLAVGAAPLLVPRRT